MGLLDSLLEVGFRQPAACVVEVGAGRQAIDELYPLVKSVELSIGRAEAAVGTIVFEDRRKEDGMWMVADSGHFRRWQSISVHADFVTHREEIFRGFVKSVKPNFPKDAGEASIAIDLQDESLALDREHMRRTWGVESPVTDRAILDELVSTLNVRPDPQSADGVRTRSLAQDGTPIAFLRERAKANGFELIFDRGSVYFGPPRVDGSPQSKITIYAGRATNCVSFAIEDESHKPDHVQFDVAPEHRGDQPITEIVEPSLLPLGRSPAASEGGDLPNFTWRVSREGDEPEEEARARAQSLADENSMKIKVTGELDGTAYGHVLRTGRTVGVDGAGDRYGGVYYVDQVTHRFSADGYLQAFTLLRNAVGESNPGSVSPLSSGKSAIAGLFAGRGVA